MKILLKSLYLNLLVVYFIYIQLYNSFCVGMCCLNTFMSAHIIQNLIRLNNSMI